MWPGDVSLSLHLPAASRWHIPLAGANLMGSDLYNSLVRYFVQHLRHLRDVRCFSRDDGIAIDPFRSIQIHYKMSFS
jgi:hypothetical protein